ncbi:hypothetical protein ACVRY7_02275 [Streptococcus ictaluri]|uniref:Uncharacterized protein n=1 Tax=Streptococcus ictaluri 707-05 TaxID=764299 RepID=G5K2H2_9STRE|nr:hypothetical protein [Streptococcus ictaluri]EHI69437.1 hypothetical protein STRIC_0984 [Streptococcus ictaluri 707-05]
MKTFINILLWIPKQICRLIWRLVLGFIQTIILLAIIIFGLIYYANHSDSALANHISNISDTVVQIMDTVTHKSTAVPITLLERNHQDI